MLFCNMGTNACAPTNLLSMFYETRAYMVFWKLSPLVLLDPMVHDRVRTCRLHTLRVHRFSLLLTFCISFVLLDLAPTSGFDSQLFQYRDSMSQTLPNRTKSYCICKSMNSGIGLVHLVARTLVCIAKSSKLIIEGDSRQWYRRRRFGRVSRRESWRCLFWRRAEWIGIELTPSLQTLDSGYPYIHTSYSWQFTGSIYYQTV